MTQYDAYEHRFGFPPNVNDMFIWVDDNADGVYSYAVYVEMLEHFKDFFFEIIDSYLDPAVEFVSRRVDVEPVSWERHMEP